jgi:hypothetical protein
MSERTVRAVLARNGLSRLPRAAADEPANRYERPGSGEMIHIDVKKIGRIGREGHRVNGDRRTRSRGIGWEFVHVAMTTAPAWRTSKCSTTSTPTASWRSCAAPSRSSTPTASRSNG